ncbi:MAG: histidine--tRNA ligase [Candidatus Micrarchaeota archaeon]|nr:histidine--tRNA ligase [Candidatus Micrarchaeota archaeon]
MQDDDKPRKAIDTPRGTSDMGFSEAIAADETISVITETFKRFGFSPIDTPAIENLSVINSKAYGDEPTKQIYTLEGGEAGMRFDFTVPLARYLAMNRNLALPFKRYQVGKVWRKDEPQRMRSREFIQADIDIVGSSELDCEAEVLAATASALDALGINGFVILLNNRRMLNSLLLSFGVPNEKEAAAVRIIDKLAKQGAEATIDQLSQGIMDRPNAEKLVAFVQESGGNDEKLSKLAANSNASQKEIEDTKKLIAMLQQYGLKCEIRVDLSLARGLDYYTSFIWEFIAFDGKKQLPSIAAGGRYDELISMFTKSKMPAVGSSIGVSRLLALFNGRKPKKSYVQVFVARIGEENREYAGTVCQLLRLGGIYTDMDVTRRSISKQLDYANSIGARYVVVVGNQERAAKKVKLRDMSSGNEELLDLAALLPRLKGV